MAPRKKVTYINGRLAGDLLDEESCSRLEKLMLDSENNQVIHSLKNSIFNLSDEDVHRVLETGSTEGVTFTKGELRDSQTLTVAYAYYAKCLVVGDSVGMGKSVIVSSLSNLLRQEANAAGQNFRFLYLAEKTSMPEQAGALVKFSGMPVHKVEGVAKSVNAFREKMYSLDGDYGVVASHSVMSSSNFVELHAEFMELYEGNFDLIVVDESAVASNTATQKYGNLMAMAEGSERRLAMNATTFENNLTAFYNQINFVDPTVLPTKTAFAEDYYVMNYRGRFPTRSGYKNAEKFRHEAGYRYFKQTRKGLGAKFEDCTSKLVTVPLTKVQKYLLGRTSMPGLVYDCPWDIDKELDISGENCSKLPALKKILNEDPDFRTARSVLIYTLNKESQRGIQEYLEEDGFGTEIMNGDTPMDVRNDIINRFKSGNLQILITNVQKALNFGSCNHSIFYTFNPNPSNMVQFEGRTTRELDIIGKHVRLIVTEGREQKKLETTVVDRALAAEEFAGADYSLILELLRKISQGDVEEDVIDEETGSVVPQKAPTGFVFK